MPEDRERVIIVGFRKDLNIDEFEFPVPRNYRVTMRDALKNIPEPTPDEVCDAPYSSRYMSRNRKRGWDDVSYTIPAMAKQVTLWPGSPDMVKVDRDLWRFGDDGVTRLRCLSHTPLFNKTVAVLSIKPSVTRRSSNYRCRQRMVVDIDKIAVLESRSRTSAVRIDNRAPGGFDREIVGGGIRCHYAA